MQLATTTKATPDSRKLPRPWQALASHSASAMDPIWKDGADAFWRKLLRKEWKIVKDVGKLETDFCEKKNLWNYSGTWNPWKQGSTHSTLVFFFSLEQRSWRQPSSSWGNRMKPGFPLTMTGTISLTNNLIDFSASSVSTVASPKKILAHQPQNQFPTPTTFFLPPNPPKTYILPPTQPNQPNPTLLPNRVLAAFCASLCNSRTKAPAPSARVKPLADSSKVLQRPSGDKAIPILQKPTSKGSKVSKFCRKFWEKVQGKYISQILCLDLFWR